MFALLDITNVKEFRDALPAGTEITAKGDRYHIAFKDHQLWLQVVRRTDTRWVAIANSSPKTFKWLQGRLDGTKVRQLTKELYLSRAAQFAALGLGPETRKGRLAFKAPHVICGNSPWTYLDDED